MPTAFDMPVYAAPVAPGQFARFPKLIQQSAHAQPGKIAVHHRDRAITWREFGRWVNRIANRLIETGLEPGETVAGLSEHELLEWANQQLGKTQRLSAIDFRDDLPRSAIGKVLKRELRAPYWEGVR